MKKVRFSRKAQEGLKRYIAHYKRYFCDIYTDTGIWSESTIRESYILEADARYQEIRAKILDRLTPEIVQGRTLVNSLLLPWRSKVIFVTWEELENDVRRITDLEIR